MLKNMEPQKNLSLGNACEKNSTSLIKEERVGRPMNAATHRSEFHSSFGVFSKLNHASPHWKPAPSTVEVACLREK